MGVAALPIEVASEDQASAASSVGCADAFEQCGGARWQGITCCKVGCHCTAHGAFFSQCQPTDPDARQCLGDITPMFMKKNTGRGPIPTRTMVEKIPRSRF